MKSNTCTKRSKQEEQDTHKVKYCSSLHSVPLHLNQISDGWSPLCDLPIQEHPETEEYDDFVFFPFGPCFPVRIIASWWSDLKRMKDRPYVEARGSRRKVVEYNLHLLDHWPVSRSSCFYHGWWYVGCLAGARSYSWRATCTHSHPWLSYVWLCKYLSQLRCHLKNALSWKFQSRGLE